MGDLLQTTANGLLCAEAGIYIDPWGKVPRAVVTHAHSDHVNPLCDCYLATPECAELLRVRLGHGINVQEIAYGECLNINGVQISLHPAGHILGSAQARLEHRGEVWVASGDYKRQPDPTCAPMEPLRCDTFITEATFALPIYRWQEPGVVMKEIEQWWRSNQERGWTSVLFAYAVGKAQRILASIDGSIGPILAHGAVLRMLEAYRCCEITLPEVLHADTENTRKHKARALVIAPPSAAASPWLRKFHPHSLAFASGWMQIRGTRRRRAADRGFVLSDHADWKALLDTIDATGAERILVTHGYTEVLTRWLKEHGRNAAVLPTRYEGEIEYDPALDVPADTTPREGEA